MFNRNFSLSRIRFNKHLLIFIAIVVCSFVAATIFSSDRANALSGSDFKAGRIIDDAVFYDTSTMNMQQIQDFLNAKVPVCDSWGNNPSGRNGYATRADWGRANGYPPPYTCLRNYTQLTVAKSAEQGLCNGYGATNQSAAQIIHGVALSCGINPRVLLVLLQKEQSLITDDWPWSIQYRSATGYGCPDTAPCDSQYYGFFNQVYSAARQFKYYAKHPSLFTYRAGRNNNILYNPSSSCGSSSVFIENQSTASLYIYTPYQPNQSALNNLYGSGDNCSAYGNRNFWRMYHDWFGTTYANCTYPTSTQEQTYRLFQPNTNSALLTSSPSEVCRATQMGYILDGTLFYPSSNAENAVYRLQKNGNYFYTISVTESNSARNAGFRLEGIGFYAATSNSSGVLKPVYRLNYPATGGYFYTISTTERDQLVQSLGYKYEGIGFYVSNNTGNTINDIYRLSHPGSGYLFTASMAERDIAAQSYGYRYEGVGFISRTGFTIDNLPVYRLSSNTGYLFTASMAERKYALSLGYRPEGISFFAYPINNTGATKVIYRLSHANGNYLYTSSQTERNTAVQSFGYKYEGIVFRTP